MKVNSFLCRREILSAVLVWCVTVSRATAAQDGPKPDIRVTEARPVHSLVITVSVSSSDEKLVVPNCGQDLLGQESLCGPPFPTHLEVQTAKGWHSVGFRTPDRVLGSLSPKIWKASEIPPGGHRKFVFLVSKDDFALETGQRVRIVVDAWHDEQSMRNGGKSLQIVSLPFNCP